MSKSSFWADHIEDWQSSGLTQRDYCRTQAISLASFGYWRRKLRSKAPPASRGLVPIAVAREGASKAMLELVLANRLMLRVPLTADPTHVARWAQVLGSC